MLNRDIEIASIVGARPNFIKLDPIHKVLKDILNHVIIHTRQHYDFELSEIFFKEFNIPKPDFDHNIGSSSPWAQSREMIKRIEMILLNNNFHLVLVYSDTNSTFAEAFGEIKAGVKVAHIDSELKSFDKRMPEEINRILTDKLSNYLFAPTLTAIDNLKKENTFGEIYNPGDLSVETVGEAIHVSNISTILCDLQLEPKSYILFTMHRAENTESDNSFISIIHTFEYLSNTKIVFPIHTRTKKILTDKNLFKRIENCHNVMIIKPVGYIDFIKLIFNSKKIITDSGGLQKEAYPLSIPCITIRQNYEGGEAVNEGWDVLANTNTEKVIDYLKNWAQLIGIKNQFLVKVTPSIIKKIIMNLIT